MEARGSRGVRGWLPLQAPVMVHYQQQVPPYHSMGDNGVREIFTMAALNIDS